MERIEAILRYWYGEFPGPQTPPAEEISRRWFTQSDETDAEIHRSFGGDLERAIAGGLDDWVETPEGRLALIVLLDQFTRNCFRDSAEAFAQDGAAQRLVTEGIGIGHDRELWVNRRLFFYMPLMHAEDLALQDECVRRYEALVTESQGELKKMAESQVDYARRHWRTIEWFGRFPHRNAVLGRPSTAEELAFLEEPDSSF